MQGANSDAHSTGYVDTSSDHVRMFDGAASGVAAVPCDNYMQQQQHNHYEQQHDNNYDQHHEQQQHGQYEQRAHYDQRYHGTAADRYEERAPSHTSHWHAQPYERSRSRSRSRSPRRSNDDAFSHRRRYDQHSDDDRYAQRSYTHQSSSEHRSNFDDRSGSYRDRNDVRYYSEQQQQQQHEPPQTLIRDAPPSRTLILRGLTAAVTERMILTALAPFGPTHARVIYNKTTGESRGFAFVKFESIHDAMQVVRAFTHGPLQLDDHSVAIGYADNSRLTPGDTSMSDPGDWFCSRCHVTNFARRSACFKCDSARDDVAQALPVGTQHRHDDAQKEGDASESATVLLVRMLPDDIEEGELHVAFAELDGVKDIRLIRDRVTHRARGFGFVEFVDAESARAALDASDTIRVHGQRVAVSFARDTTPPPSSSRSSASYAPSAANSIAAAALEQAQWSLGNGYSSAAAASASAHQQQTRGRRSHGHLDADVDAFLATAVAAAEAPTAAALRPKKQWPLPFETGGGSYVFASDVGLYWHGDSAFYYDPQARLYLSAYLGQYFTCHDGATFEVFGPPPPPDAAVFSAVNNSTMAAPALSAATAGATGAKTVTLSLPPAKRKDKKPAIAFGVLAPLAHKPTEPQTSLKRKSAVDIAKWSQLQRSAKTGESSEQSQQQQQSKQPQPQRRSETSQAPTTSNAELDQLVNGVVAAEAPICLLCRRKFASIEQLRKHEALSPLHLANVAKAKAHKDALAAEHREREQERKDRDERQQPPHKRPRSATTATSAAAPTGASTTSATTPTEAVATDPSASLESSIGGKMLKMMGWKRGEGLGKHGTGITAPVAAVGNVSNDLAGIGARSSTAAAVPALDRSDMAAYKERLQQMARARYDATPRGL